MLRQKLRTKDLHKNVVFGQKTGKFTIQHQLHSHQQPNFPMISAMSKEFPATTYAWFLHDHLGSTVAVYGSSENGEGQLGLEHAYEYRSFGEMAELTSSADKVTENFTGKERDDETGLSYHEARYLDPMLGVWISVDPKRFFNSPYLYMGNGYNPIRFADLNGQAPGDVYLFYPDKSGGSTLIAAEPLLLGGKKSTPGFSHTAVEIKNGEMFSADLVKGVFIEKVDQSLANRDGVIMRPKANLDIDALDSYACNAEGGKYLKDGVCSSEVLNALEAGGLDLQVNPSVMDWITSPIESLERWVPHPSNLADNPSLEKIGEFNNE